MSLARLALRLAAIEALAPALLVEAGGPFPTIAGPRVYDSRQDPVDALDDVDGKPLVLIYTENHDYHPYPKGVSSPDNSVVHLFVELMIAAKGAVSFELPDGTIQTTGTLETPIMESEQEALLDLLEATVIRRLQGRTSVDASTQLFRTIAMEIHGVESIPARDETRTVRLAARTLIIKIKIPADNWPEPGLTAGAATGFALLPAPLSLVAQSLPSVSPGLAICTQLAASLANNAAHAPIERAELNVFVDRAPTGTPDITGHS